MMAVQKRKGIIKSHGGDPRHHIASRFAGTTLLEKNLLNETRNNPIRMLPDLNVIKIGGQSCIDYGKSAVYPIVEEIVKARKRHQLLIITGGGTRARHVYDIALDLGLPTGVLATLGEQIANQNAVMLFALLAKYGGIRLSKDQVESLPQYLSEGYIPIMNGMPPYHWWEPPPETGSIPAHRTDVGAYLLSEVLGAKRMIYVKDEEGLYTDNPKKNPQAKFIRKIEVRKLLGMELPDSVVEPPIFTMMQRARFMKRIQVINGRTRGNLLKALSGREVGSIIYAD